MNLLDALARLFAPDSCLVCRREGSLLCVGCTARLPRVLGRCFGCYARVSESIVCTGCLQLSGCRQMSAVAAYQGVAKELVARLKFAANQSAAEIMARLMVVCLPKEPILLVHVPATTGHIRERGYDQASLIAKRLAALSGRRHCSVLARSGQRHQLGSKRRERHEQLVSALRVTRPTLVRGQHIVLIDDVLTTGTSVCTAAALLLGAQARSVSVITFAQALSEQK